MVARVAMELPSESGTAPLDVGDVAPNSSRGDGPEAADLLGSTKRIMDADGANVREDSESNIVRWVTEGGAPGYKPSDYSFGGEEPAAYRRETVWRTMAAVSDDSEEEEGEGEEVTPAEEAVADGAAHAADHLATKATPPPAVSATPPQDAEAPTAKAHPTRPRAPTSARVSALYRGRASSAGGGVSFRDAGDGSIRHSSRPSALTSIRDERRPTFAVDMWMAPLSEVAPSEGGEEDGAASSSPRVPSVSIAMQQRISIVRGGGGGSGGSEAALAVQVEADADGSASDSSDDEERAQRGAEWRQHGGPSSPAKAKSGTATRQHGAGLWRKVRQRLRVSSALAPSPRSVGNRRSPEDQFYQVAMTAATAAPAAAAASMAAAPPKRPRDCRPRPRQLSPSRSRHPRPSEAPHGLSPRLYRRCPPASGRPPRCHHAGRRRQTPR